MSEYQEIVKYVGESMQYASLVLLTVLIPFGIAVLERDKEKVLERYVFLDHILKMRNASWALFGIIFPLLFWHWTLGKDFFSWNTWLLFLFLFIWIPSFIFFGFVLKDIYNWLKKKDIKEYKLYLEKEKSDEDLQVVWGEVWKRREEFWGTELEFFKIFSGKMDSSLKKKKTGLVGKSLSEFLQFIDKRSLLFLLSEEVFPKILSWHQKAWELPREEFLQNDEQRREDNHLYKYHHFLRICNEIIENVEKRVLLEGGFVYNFFDMSDKHTQKYENLYKEAHSENEKKEIEIYLESIPFQKIFYENIDKVENKYEIEDYCFPPSWKVSLENIKKGMVMPRIWLDRYLRWMQERVNASKKDYDYDDELVWATRILFPGVHMVYFPYILVYAVRSWVNRNRIKELIDNPPNFGGYYYNPLLDAFGKTEEELEGERNADWEKSKQYTFKLSVKIFRISSKQIKENIQELQSLQEECKKNPKKEARRKIILEIFEGLQERTRIKKTIEKGSDIFLQKEF
jgi:hypothetical protein